MFLKTKWTFRFYILKYQWIKEHIDSDCHEKLHQCSRPGQPRTVTPSLPPWCYFPNSQILSCIALHCKVYNYNLHTFLPMDYYEQTKVF